MRRINNIADVERWRLCMGCGACVPFCLQRAIRLVDIQDRGLRPVIDKEKCVKCGRCLIVCPGIEISHKKFCSETIPALRQSWGPVLEVWEGYAADPEIRYKASSGGVATALALFCVDTKRASAVFHIGTKPESPLRNVPVISRYKEELLKFTGSRYSPAAPCEKLKWIEEVNSSCVFIGKPCDVVALRKSQSVDDKLDSKVGLAISIFCAGTPSSQGTNMLLTSLGVKPEQVEELRYRGYGWPGMTTVKLKGTNDEQREMTYEESWDNILSNYGQLRCRLCPDGTGEFADISCGDPWYRSVEPNEPGQSLVLVRTENGRLVLQRAMQEGYVHLQRIEPETVFLSQKGLLNKRRNLWGRLLAMRVMRIPVPDFHGFPLFSNWRVLSMRGKIYSVLGTFWRIERCKWSKPLRLDKSIDLSEKNKIEIKPQCEK